MQQRELDQQQQQLQQQMQEQESQPQPEDFVKPKANEKKDKKSKKAEERRRQKEAKKAAEQAQENRYIPGMDGSTKPEDPVTAEKMLREEQEAKQQQALLRLQVRYR